VLASSETAVRGQTFIIADADALSWAEFHRYYAEAMGIEMRGVAMEELERLRQEQTAGGWVQRLLAWPRGIRTALTSPEAASLARKVLKTPPLGTAPRYLMEKVPGLRRRLKHAFKLDRPRLYKPSQVPHKLPPLGLLELYACPASVSAEKARRVLGYGPLVGREEAMQRTLDWLRYARYL
ncbi:MAG TPA: hypothetical protein VFA18_22485, partial [Gemmataceae bacterium]|nr:hypothetical protein [Gemmataceae bacterium]